MNKIEQIKLAIKNGVNKHSKLTEEPLNGVGGFTSPNIRHIMNNLGAISTSYLDVGAHIGCSLIMTRFGNDNLNYAISIDNWSEFQNDGRTKDEFISNCERHIPGKYTFIEKNCFKVTNDEIPDPIDLFLYDAGHDFESQKEGVTHFVPMMAEEFVLMVDDTAWKAPREGTYAGIKEAGLEILWETFLFDGIEGGSFWNGFSIFLLKKQS